MTTRLLLVPLVAGLVITAVMPSVLGFLQRKSVLDYPTQRSSHTNPVLRGGGIAVALGLVAALLVSTSPLLPTSALLAATLLFASIGLAEDIFGIPPLHRFALQALAGSAVAALLTARGGSHWLIVPLIVLWIVSYTNAFNFMDGINGISAAQALVAGVSYAGLGAWVHRYMLLAGGLALAGAAVAFAPWNIPVARVFLGDVGSYALGAVIATLGVLAWLSGITVEAAVAPLAVYLADTGACLLRRLRAGEAWYLPHRLHVYQRLTDLGWSHVRVTALVCLVAAGCAGLGAVTLNAPVASRVLADALLAAVLTGYLALPHLARRVSGRVRAA